MNVATSNQENSVVLTKERDKKLLFKIDLYILPLICFLYALQFMDKTSISIAAVMGLKIDLGMVGTMYSWAGTAFYLGYLVFVYPSSYALQRLPLAKALGIFIFVWGGILACHAACTSYVGFMVCRVLLGALESAVTPGMVVITSQWYKIDEQFLRTAIWFACNGLGTIIGSGIGYGITTHMASYSILPWKVLFIVEGCMTMVVGIAFYIHIPDNPSKAWFLTDEEKALVVERIKTNEQGFGNKHFKSYQFKEAVTDIQTWLFFLFGLATDIPNGAVTNFSAILLADDFGYSTTQTMLMGMPGGGVEIVGCIFFAWCARFVKHRLAVAEFSIMISLMAVCMLAFAKNMHAQLAGLYLTSIMPVGIICSLSCFSSNTAGHTKKLTTNAIYLIGYCVGNIIGPQTMLSSQAPGYSGGKIAFVVSFAAALVFLSLIYYVYWKRNRDRDRLDTEEEKPQIENHAFADLTDMENPYFRYAL